MNISDYIKLYLLRALFSSQQCDVTCLSEFYLNSNAYHKDVNQEIKCCALIRDTNPSNTKQDCVGIYYKN